MGTLYLVATPIGNMEDITLRAIRILGEVEIIACEDTRKTGLLLEKLNIAKKAKLLSYYEENEKNRLPQIIQFLQENKNVALVSNAGTPTIADPGFKLVRECLVRKIKVVSLPGPSALLTALTASGLPTDKFLFLGYLPKKASRRQKILESCRQLPFSCTLIFYESPYRLIRSLTDIKQIFGNLEIVVASELTKMFEKFEKGKIDQLKEVFIRQRPRGEFTIILRLLSFFAFFILFILRVY